MSAGELPAALTRGYSNSFTDMLMTHPVARQVGTLTKKQLDEMDKADDADK